MCIRDSSNGGTSSAVAGSSLPAVSVPFAS
jgi:hypothetical protein